MGNDISGFGDFGLFDKCILVLLFISMVSIGILPHALEPYFGFYQTIKPCGNYITSELIDFKTSGEATSFKIL